MIETDHDRREDPRVSLTRPCKVLEPRSGKYIGGMTCNVGGGGLLLRLDRRVAVAPGDRLYVGIVRRPRQSVLRTADMIEASVVRALGITTGETAVAVQFCEPSDGLHLPLPLAA